ncbi:MAG: flavodoxin family protein [bacterium]|jgi:multimeric flavodoxin WrbA
MRVMVFTASPNEDGLTAACGQAALAGAREGGAEVALIDLNRLSYDKCQACGRGYGTCLSEHACQVEDDFQAVHRQLLAADAYCIVTPVYWGEMSESAKAFFDRVRRCEATKTFRGTKSGLDGKPAIGVAAAGGTGNGTVTCLLSLQLFFQHTRSEIFDLITVTQKSRSYKLAAIKAAVRAMTRPAGE